MPFIINYINKSKYYKEVLDSLEELDKKYLLPVIINDANFLEGKVLYEVLKETDKSMNEEVNKYKFSQEEYREYIEMWVHEVKSPIASSKLIIENNKNKETLSILEDFEKIEEHIEQVLFYARSSNLEKDYIIKKIDLRKCINNVIRKNKKALINNNISLDIDNIKDTIYCDNKWLEFILNQIIINSIKYKRENPKIKFYTK